EPCRPLLVTLAQLLRREGLPVRWIDLRVILEPQRERIDSELGSELVHRDLHRDEPDAFERCAHRSRIAAMDAHEAMRRADRRASIERARPDAGAFDVVADIRASEHAVMADAGQPPLLRRADRQRLDRCRLIAMAREGLRAGQHELYRPAELTGRHRRQELMRPDPALAAEAAANELVLHAHPARVEPHRLRDHRASIDDTLHGIE